MSMERNVPRSARDPSTGKSCELGVELALHERPLTDFTSGVKEGSFTMSPDGKRAAYVVARGENQVAVVDGVEGKQFADIDNLMFSPDGTTVAYRAKADMNHWYAVVNNREEGPYKFVSELVFSPDSKRLASVVKYEDQTWAVIVDGAAGHKYGALGPKGRTIKRTPFFSPDSKRIAYTVASYSAWERVVVDEVEQKEYKFIMNLMFSSDSQHVAYSAQPEYGSPCAVVDGLETTYRRESEIVIGPDVKRIACVELHRPDVSVAVKTQRVILDGKAEKQYDNIRDVTFSADGRRLAYIASSGELYGTTVEQVVVDGIEGKTYRPYINKLRFSPDGRHVAYTARVEDGYAVVVDGCEKAYDCISGYGNPSEESVRFSPDSHRFAYVGHFGDTKVAVVDHLPRQRGRYDDVPHIPVFSPDGKCVGYAGKHTGKWHIVINGTETGDYDELPRGGALVFDGPTTLRTFAVREGKLLFVEVQIRLVSPDPNSQ